MRFHSIMIQSVLVLGLAVQSGCRVEQGDCSSGPGHLCLRINQAGLPQAPTELCLSLRAMVDGGTLRLDRYQDNVGVAFTARHRFVAQIDTTPVAGAPIHIKVSALSDGTAETDWLPGAPDPVLDLVPGGNGVADCMKAPDLAMSPDMPDLAKAPDMPDLAKSPDMANPCGKDLPSDPDNCGACGNACLGVGPTRAHCIGGQCAKRVFVTSSLHSGALGGLTEADNLCRMIGQGANLGKSDFKAWLSSASIAAKDRLAHSTATYTLVDGTTVAIGWDGPQGLASGSLFSPINLTERGAKPTDAMIAMCPGPAAWTNTTALGTIAGANDCTKWASSTNGSGSWGSPLANDGQWTITKCNAGLNGCNKSASLYCIEQ